MLAIRTIPPMNQMYERHHTGQTQMHMLAVFHFPRKPISVEHIFLGLKCLFPRNCLCEAVDEVGH
jgi:hypothetical protein